VFCVCVCMLLARVCVFWAWSLFYMLRYIHKYKLGGML
jgi:hypothetical protein